MWHLTQPLRLVIIIALGNRGPGSSPFLFPFPSHRVETPFRPSPHGLQAPTRSILSFLPFFLPFSLVLQHRPLSLSLSHSLFLRTRWFIHSVNRGPVGRFRLLFLGFHEGKRAWKKKKKKKRNVSQTRFGSRTLGVLVGFRRNPPPRRWDPLFY